MERVAVVTGGARGIGAAIAKKLRDNGARVVVVDKADTSPVSIERGIRYVGGVDVSEFEQVQETFAEAIGDIDILVNNAGITRDGMMHKMTVEQWTAVLQVNLFSCFNTTRAVINGMRNRGYGRIINISSINGLKGQLGQANYCAAKAGMIGFTKAIAQELAQKGVTANCVAPGYIQTEMTGAMKAEVLDHIRQEIPMHHLGTTEDIASVVAFLASDAAGFITGQVFSVNGGQYM